MPSPTPTLPATATLAPTMTPTPVLLSLPHLRLAYGIQAYAVGDPEQVIKAVQDLGLSWLKQEIRWFDFEPTKGEYDWTVLDALVDACDVAGIALLLNVVDAPAWARSHAGVDALLGGPPDDVQDFADLMGAIAKRYQGRVRAYEIWSEQNTKRNWGDVPPNAADYVQLLDAAYRSIKAADPSAIVVSGALAPTGVNDGKWAIDNLIYLQQMYDAGLKAACDAVGIHAPGYANPPDVYYQGGDIDPVRGYDDHPVFFFRNTVEDSYAVMDKNGDGSKRLWITRFGWGTVDGMDMKPNPGYEFTADIDEQQQAEYVADAIAWAQEWGYVEGMFLWNLNFWPIAGAKTEMAKFSIVRDDWSPRPVYTAIKALLDIPLPVGTLQGTGTFSWPTSGVLSARFGFRTGDGTWHGGLDIATHKGNEVFAADSGLVIFAGWRDGYGNIVIVNHLNGFETTYAHLDKIGASVGQSVRKGAAIGTVGETGITTGPHLHFELHKKGARVDPEAYLP